VLAGVLSSFSSHVTVVERIGYGDLVFGLADQRGDIMRGTF
jgi:hypothetical protein